MNIKEYTESVIAHYLQNGGTVHPDITLDIFQMIENNQALLNEYKAICDSYKVVNPTIGKSIRQYFDLRNDKTIDVNGRCSLITTYMRFHQA